mmetsp:Transcript_66754/g.118109  ORF Transcript_66754/g.118109 Transcript_66754/m.118109 type:complete len:200 (-) Transcript_66754:21-620(-)
MEAFEQVLPTPGAESGRQRSPDKQRPFSMPGLFTFANTAESFGPVGLQARGSTSCSSACSSLCTHALATLQLHGTEKSRVGRASPWSTQLGGLRRCRHLSRVSVVRPCSYNSCSRACRWPQSETSACSQPAIARSGPHRALHGRALGIHTPCFGTHCPTSRGTSWVLGCLGWLQRVATNLDLMKSLATVLKLRKNHSMI